MQDKGKRGLNVLCAGGEVRLERKYFWSKRAGSLCPADALVDVTPRASQLCCLMGIGQDFDQARRDLKRVGGLTVSKERLRQMTEGEGEQVRQMRDGGELRKTHRHVLATEKLSGILPPCWPAMQDKSALS
jgi:hypothetical protein